MPTKRVYLPFKEARDYVRELELKRTEEWAEYSKKDRPPNIPGNPAVVYKNKGWVLGQIDDIQKKESK